MDPDASDEMTDHLVDFFDQIASSSQPPSVASMFSMSPPARGWSLTWWRPMSRPAA